MLLDPKKLILIGGGGHCKSVLAVLEDLPNYDVVGILDVPEKVGTEICGKPIIGTDDDIESLADKCDCVMITVGQIKSSELRERLYDRVKAAGLELATVVGQKSKVASTAKLGEGTIIMDYALVNADAQVGHNCIINTRALIEHDAIVGNHCHLSTGSIVNGSSKIGDGSFVGSSACVIDGLKVGSNVIIGAGATVIRDVPDNSTIVGQQARQV